MTPEERLKMISDMMSNPCKDNEHDYEPMVAGIGKATMLHQMCKKCFDLRGWVYDWQEEFNQED